MSTAGGPILFVTVGTDHHPFDRLVEWTERIARIRPDVEVVVQHGHSRVPVGVAFAASMLPYERLQTFLEHATVVACHGGPATIMEVRGAGRLPVVVPRRSDLGEHVDDHQVRFARRLGQVGHVQLAEQEAIFARIVASSLEGGGRTATSWPADDGDAAIARTMQMLDELERSSRPKRAFGRHLGRISR